MIVLGDNEGDIGANLIVLIEGTVLVKGTVLVVSTVLVVVDAFNTMMKLNPKMMKMTHYVV
jgi:hypothetical protein